MPPLVFNKVKEFLNLVDSIRSPELLNRYFPDIETLFHQALRDDKDITYETMKRAFTKLLEVIDVHGLNKEHFSALLETTDKFFIKYEDKGDLTVLKVLTDSGFSIAKEIFKELIVKRFTNGCYYEMWTVIEEEYMNYLNEEERLLVLDDPKLTEEAVLDLISVAYYDILHNDRNFSKLFEVIRGSYLIKKSSLMTELFSGELLDEDGMYILFHELIKSLKKTKSLKENFFDLFNLIEKFSLYPQYHLLYGLIDAIEDRDLLNQYYSIIKTKFEELLDRIDEFEWDQILDSFSVLMKTSKATGLIKEEFSKVIDVFSNLPPKFNISSFSILIDALKGTDLINIHYNIIEKLCLERLNEIFGLALHYQYPNLVSLINSISGTKMLDERFVDFLNAIDKLKHNNKFFAFSEIINAIKDAKVFNRYSNLITQKYSELLNEFDNLSLHIPFTYCKLIESVKDTKLINENYSFIEAKCLELLEIFKRNIIENLRIKRPKDWYDLEDNWSFMYFMIFVRKIKGTTLYDTHYSIIETIFVEFFDNIDSLEYPDSVFFYLIDSIKETSVELINHQNILNLMNSFDKLTREEKNKRFLKLSDELKRVRHNIVRDNISIIKKRFPEYANELEEFFKRKGKKLYD